MPTIKILLLFQTARAIAIIITTTITIIRTFWMGVLSFRWIDKMIGSDRECIILVGGKETLE